MTEPRLDEQERPFDEVDAFEVVDEYLREDAYPVVLTIARHMDAGRDVAADSLIEQLATEIDDAGLAQGWFGRLTCRSLVADAALDTEVGE